MNKKRGADRGGGADHWQMRDMAMARAELEEILHYHPCNVEAEAALLGAMMIDNRLVESVSALLKPEHFFEPLHGSLYERIVTLVGRGKAATPVTLRPYFDGQSIDYVDDDGVGTSFTFVSYLAKLTGSGAGLIAAPSLKQQIFDLAISRQIVDVARAMAEAAIDTKEDIDPRRAIARAEAALTEIGEAAAGGGVSTTVSIDTAWDEAFEEIQGIAAGVPQSGILISGYDDWNDVCGRMEAGDLIYLGARPSMGKTGVSCKVALGAAKAGHPTEYLSLEMIRKRIARRMIADEMFHEGVTSSYSALGKGKLTADDKIAIANARAAIDDLPLNISDPDQMNVEEVVGFIRARQRAWQRKGKVLKLVVIDYLGRLGTAKDFRNPSERVTHISNMLKTAAKLTGVVLVVLVQLSRAVEAREDKHPVLQDLRDSGSLEQDADVVIFIYRDEYYLRQNEPRYVDAKKFAAWQDDMIASRDRLEIYSAKVREGAPHKRTGYFFTEYQAIRDSLFYRSTYRDSTDAFDFGSAAGDTSREGTGV